MPIQKRRRDKRPNRTVLNYSGKVCRLDKKVGSLLAGDLVLPSLGKPQVEREDVRDGGFFVSRSIRVVGLPDPIAGCVFLVAEPIAMLLCGQRRDLCVAVEVLEETPDAVRCRDLAHVYVHS
jgi:hypothetical protein